MERTGAVVGAVVLVVVVVEEAGAAGGSVSVSVSLMAGVMVVGVVGAVEAALVLTYLCLEFEISAWWLVGPVARALWRGGAGMSWHDHRSVDRGDRQLQ